MKPQGRNVRLHHCLFRGQESWLGRGHRISLHTCTCCTVMLHASCSCADAEVAFEYMHVECTARIGNVMSLRLWTSKIFSSCALQTFLLPLTHNLAKVPPSAVLAFSRPSPSPSLFALVDSSAQIAWTARETERFTSMFGFCAEHRQGSSPSVLSRGVLQESGILVVWSHFNRQTWCWSPSIQHRTVYERSTAVLLHS